jgi:hypothetical protein
MERFDLKKLNKVDGKEQDLVEVLNRLAALENLDTEVDINRAWDSITENINNSAKESLGYYELRNHDERYPESLDERKQDKL